MPRTSKALSCRRPRTPLRCSVAAAVLCLMMHSPFGCALLLIETTVLHLAMYGVCVRACIQYTHTQTCHHELHGSPLLCAAGRFREAAAAAETQDSHMVRFLWQERIAYSQTLVASSHAAQLVASKARFNVLGFRRALSG